VVGSPEAIAAEIERWLGSTSPTPTGLSVVAGRAPDVLSRVLALLEGPPSRRRVRLGEAFARELSACDPWRRPRESADALTRALTIDAPVALVDRIEALFHPELELHVLPALDLAARGRVLVVAWPIPSEEARRLFASSRVLSYATEGHPEHVRVAAGNFPVWCVG